MKKIYSFVFIAAILLSTVSCSDDNSNGETSSIQPRSNDDSGSRNVPAILNMAFKGISSGVAK